MTLALVGTRSRDLVGVNPAAPPTWDETALDLFTRIDEPPLALLPPLLVRPGQAVEVFGERGSGKTALLIQCVINCVLPQRVDGRRFDGHRVSCTVLDTEGTFSVALMADMLQRRLLSGGLEPGRAEFETRRCLERVHICRCTTRREFLCAVASLCHSLDDETSQSAPHVGATVLLIDSISAFQWADRAEQRPQLARLAPADVAASATFDQQIASLLHWLRTERQMLVVWTRTPQQSHASGFEFPTVDASRACAATHRVRLRKERVGTSGEGSEIQALLEHEMATPTGTKAMGAALRCDVSLFPWVKLRPV